MAASADPGMPPGAGGRPKVRPKVIYLMGAGRSGSTILGVALGNCEGVFFAGELDRWLARGGVPRDGPQRQLFWRGVREQVADPDGLSGGRGTWLERSSAALDPRRWPARRRLRPRYRRVSQSLYEAIASAANASHVVDSSHYPMRAREMQALAGVELHLLFLVRDPQGVVASLGRDDVPERRFGVVAANAYLWLTHLLAVWVFLRHPRDRRILVRYEDFLARPQSVLSQILRQSGAPDSRPDLAALRTGVPFHGNRLIGEETVALGSDAARPRPRRSLMTAVAQLPSLAVLSRLRPATSASAAAERARVAG
jgi:Sulfotransferase family